MTMILAAVDPELAEHGRCWMCKQWFINDGVYYQVGIPGLQDIAVWSTCIGCGVQLALAEKPPAEPG